MRQRAAESDVVIVNHHLLCADAAVRESAYGEVIPSCPQLVVDEAHQLEDVATQYFGRGVSNLRIDDLGRDAEAALRAAVVAPGATAKHDTSRGVMRVMDHARAFFSGLALARMSRGDERLRVAPRVVRRSPADGPGSGRRPRRTAGHVRAHGRGPRPRGPGR